MGAPPNEATANIEQKTSLQNRPLNKTMHSSNANLTCKPHRGKNGKLLFWEVIESEVHESE
jgi:hypothetical protein